MVGKNCLNLGLKFDSYHVTALFMEHASSRDICLLLIYLL